MANNSSTNTTIAIGVAAIVVLGVLIWAFVWGPLGNAAKLGRISNFEECKEAGYTILESYPEQCKTPDGKTFKRDISKDGGETVPEGSGEDDGPAGGTVPEGSGIDDGAAGGTVPAGSGIDDGPAGGN